MHKVNAGYTLLLPLADAAAATKRLGELDATWLPFAQMTTVHFATVTILPAQRYGDTELPATLLFATSFCGPALAHVDELVAVMERGLRELFQFCEGFAIGCTRAQLVAFIRAHRHADTFYSGMQHLSPADVAAHRKLREAIEDYIDTRRPTGTAVAIRARIQDYVKKEPELAWAEAPFAPGWDAFLALHWRTLIAGAIAVPCLAALAICTALHCAAAPYLWLALGGIVAVIGVLLCALRYSECQQRAVSERQPDAQVRMLAATQNRPVINEMTIGGPIKAGWSRPLVLRMAYWVVARLAEGIPGMRAGINIPTVATARWIAGDGGRRLIFISNFTNAAEPYVRDFIDVEDGAKRINLTFGFGNLYPRTEWIIDGGALTDPNGFIYVVTEQQRPTAFWYGRYLDMSIDNIKRNRQIREGLFAALPERKAEAQAQAWLHLL